MLKLFESFMNLSFQIDRSGHLRCSIKKGVPKNFAKFTRKHLCLSLFLKKVTGVRTATLLKKSLRHRFFPVNFTKWLGTPFLQNISGQLLLNRCSLKRDLSSWKLRPAVFLKYNNQTLLCIFVF